ncbi:MAG TPA: fibronectin type III domain-containing protein [Solirubrobacteraceae bacterium]|jgi:type II secretory pathway pseudopilin PulG|nr:fibronectin type III domain-containing protein [Solirubrobacteraceae bacterium]
MPIFSRRAREGSGGRAPRTRLASEDGFTLFEVLVAAVILVVGLTSLFGLLDVSLKASASNRAREGATNLARQVLEDAQSIPYSQLAPSSIVGELQAMNGLANGGSGAAWEIVRRGIVYTVKVNECSIDDPKDGYGVHKNGLGENPFCGDSKTEGTEKEDPQPEDLKRVTVDVSWVAKGRSPVVHQVETVTAAGEAPGLNASGLQLSLPKVGAPSAPLISTQPAESKLVFTVKSPKGTEAMAWSLDGVRQATAPTFVSGTEWTFSWLIPKPEVSDGTYHVAVQAIDATGVYGPPTSISVTLIRGAPLAPKVTHAGFNEIMSGGVKTKVAELQWEANTERNVIGYRVYNASHELECPKAGELTNAQSCIDLKLAPKATESNQTYQVVALYRKAEGEVLSKEVSESAAASVVLEKGPPTAPNVPGAPLAATKNADGSVTLKWSAPSGGPAVIFYRVYRGSEDYTNRNAVVIVGTTEFTDTQAESAHNYWVTAVNTNLTESPFLGPVKA